MKKIISLIKACMTENMSLFKIKLKSNKKFFKVIIPIILSIICMYSVWIYADVFIDPLTKIHQEYILLSLFVMGSFILTLIEGIYKSSSLLFNSKDDDLLLSLPISKSTITFIRIFKFFIFELFYNSIFILPAIGVYILNVNVDTSFYISSLFMILFLPIIPIVISCIIGKLILRVSSKFKLKNIIQTIITILLLLTIFYFSFNIQSLISRFSEKANVINNIITKLYYPAYAYVKMVTEFKVIDLLLFVIINILIFLFGIFILSRNYTKFNSNIKKVVNASKKKEMCSQTKKTYYFFD